MARAAAPPARRARRSDAWLARRSTRSSPSSRSRSSTRRAARRASTPSSWSPRRLTCARRAAAPFADREARLIPDEEKLRRADFAYVNDGSLEDLDAFVAGVVEELDRRPEADRLLLARRRRRARASSSYLQRTEPAWWARLWYPLHYERSCAGTRSNYDLNPALLAAVIEQESKFDADARSSAGAIGLMQLQPATAKGIAMHTGGSTFVLSDLDDPEINVRYGSWYLHHLLDKYGTTSGSRSRRTTPGRRTSTLARSGEDIQFPETRAYVDRVERLKDIYRRAYARELGL